MLQRRPRARGSRLREAVGLALLLATGGCANHMLTEPPVVSYALGDEAFVRSVEGSVGQPLLEGNRVEALFHGEEIIAHMLHEIGRAERSITLETYVWWESGVETLFTEALVRRARAGVRTHVLLDAFGNTMSEHSREQLERAGVEVASYRPVAGGILDGSANNRTHRRVLVIDGRRGLTGGAGIGQEWVSDPKRGGAWRDTQFVVEGPVVAQLQAVFADNWLEVTGELLQGDLYFPPLAAAGATRAQAIASSPQGSANARVAILLALGAAQERVRIMNAYFVPDEVLTEALVACEQRGVEVQIILPGSTTDLPFVRRASRARWGPLLRAGVEIYEYQPTMYHCKVLVIDGLWVTGGTTNLDPRSFHLNDEVDLNVLDRDVAAAQDAAFERDLRRSRRITLDAWEDRTLFQEWKDWFASLFGDTL